jgi:hypothetical protein
MSVRGVPAEAAADRQNDANAPNQTSGRVLRTGTQPRARNRQRSRAGPPTTQIKAANRSCVWQAGSVIGDEPQTATLVSAHRQSGYLHAADQFQTTATNENLAASSVIAATQRSVAIYTNVTGTRPKRWGWPKAAPPPRWPKRQVASDAAQNLGVFTVHQLSTRELKSISEAQFTAFEKHSCNWSDKLSGRICKFTYSTRFLAGELSVLRAQGSLSGTFFLK